MSMISMSPSSSSSGKRMKHFLACNRPDWSALPCDILSSIIDRLDIDDLPRFGVVCIHWRSIFLRTNRPSCCRLPFLLVPTPPPDAPHPHHRALYGVSTKKLYHFRLQLPRHNVCRGSSFGWLVTLVIKPRCEDCRVQLLNPFLNRTIHLPSLDSIVQLLCEDSNTLAYYFRKAVLSCDPLSPTGDFVVMAIMDSRTHTGLAFVRPGNTCWNSIGNDWRRETLDWSFFSDIIFSHKTSQFYALLSNGSVMAVDLLGDESGNPKLTQIAPLLYTQSFGEVIRYCMYLVEDSSSGDLFQVCKVQRHSISLDDAFQDAFRTGKFNGYGALIVQFTVFKLDTSHGIWTKVDDLGEKTMFLGNNGSILRSTSDCPGCEPNCIYFIDKDDQLRVNFDHIGPPYDGIYDLKDGTIRPHYSCARYADMVSPTLTICLSLQPDLQNKESHTFFKLPSPAEVLPQSIWIEPNLKGCN